MAPKAAGVLRTARGEVLRVKSPAEFFSENKNIAGFDNPGKSLYTTIRELVENSLDACEAAGEKAADQKFGTEEVAFERTAGGDRFRDLTPGTGKKAAQGDAVEIRYRVMRLGTRARDGLSGEGQTSATPRARTHHQPESATSCLMCVPSAFCFGSLQLRLRRGRGQGG